MKKGIILASSSVSRYKILQAAGINFQVVNHLIDEDKEKQRIISENNTRLGKIPEALALKKAESISKKIRKSIIIGCDQVLVHNGQVFSKPKSFDDLIKQLSILQGNSHEIFSSCSIVKNSNKLWSCTDRAVLTMRTLNTKQIEDYVKDNWEEVNSSVGGYHIESKGIKLFRNIEGHFFTILGVPLTQLMNFLISINVVEL
jgi:septum formation protein